MNELVSIIVPVYNVERYLARCVDSLVGQTYKNIDIILVDDGSRDSSGAICDSFAEKDDRVVVIHKENEGVGLARNTALGIARGKYVMFVDSDDYLDPRTVEKCISKRDEMNVDAVFFGRVDHFDNGILKIAPVSSDKLYFEGEEVVSDLLHSLFTYERGLSISVWGCLFDLEAMHREGIIFRSEKKLLAEDAYFLLEMFPYISSAAVLTDNLYYYYQNVASISRRHNLGHQLRANAFLQASLEKCQQMDYPKQLVDCVRVRYHIYTLSGMKRILRSDLPKKEKRKELKKVFTDSVLRASFTKGSLGREGLALRIFWTALRARLYIVCYLLLLYKIKR